MRTAQAATANTKSPTAQPLDVAPPSLPRLSLANVIVFKLGAPMTQSLRAIKLTKLKASGFRSVDASRSAPISTPRRKLDVPHPRRRIAHLPARVRPTREVKQRHYDNENGVEQRETPHVTIRRRRIHHRMIREQPRIRPPFTHQRHDHRGKMNRRDMQQV